MHGSLVSVQIEDRTLVVAARRRLNWEGGEPDDSRLVVGDQADVELTGTDGVIVGVGLRRTSLLRKAPSANRAQVLAANVDQALVMFAARVPEPKQGLLDRFLVACSISKIHPIIAVNKVDQGLKKVDEWLDVYRELGYDVLLVSARTMRGMGEIKRRLIGQTTLFCGPSGVGKSSLLNAVYPGFQLRVGSISEATGKGRHITTQAELMPLPYGGFVVDTPGLKEFGLWCLNRADLEYAFPELDRLEERCRFSNCSHDHEPDCAVKEALSQGVFDPGRFRSLTALQEEISAE
ncbi:MAG: ribosome small subunit-dependent GTPase A [bacterium]|nr:ribosome small subunit-dependent GTPase A [bacterium]